MTFFYGTLSLLIGYLFGCFQSSYFISYLVSKKDIREIGSGNAGASNVTSEFGWKYGMLTGVLDVMKAYIPIQLVVNIFPYTLQQLDIMVLAGTGAVLGHIYPFFMDFRGGKGVACYIGMLLGIEFHMGLVAIIGLIIITIITDYVSIGSILLYSIIPILTFKIGEYSNIVIQCTLVLFIVGMIKHRINIQRILRGNEIGLRSVYNKNKIK